MLIGIYQTNPTIGDLDANLIQIVDALEHARLNGATLAILPELALCGYPPRDLLDRKGFVEQMLSHLESIINRVTGDIWLLVGFVDATGSAKNRKLFNAAALIHNREIEAVIHKRLLPTYDVFDEDRYFEPGTSASVVTIDSKRFGITICEDAWNDVDTPFRHHYDHDPVADCVAQGAEVIINISASPFNLAKRLGREQMLSKIAARHGRPLVFVNQAGGNDDLLFDGSSSVFGPNGQIWARAAAFRQDALVVELAPGQSVVPPYLSDQAAVLDALTMGTRDYVQKCGFRSVVLGLSGGVDSALVACIAARSIGPEHVYGVAMPTRYSSQASLDDAQALARALGIHYQIIAIDGVFQSYIDLLGPRLDSAVGIAGEDTTFENIQARIRCAVLMAISNRSSHLLLTTGNKSELAVGYCTLYGDMAGGLAVISDLPKTFVYRVAEEVNAQAGTPIIPISILTKPPSAELRPNQTDQDNLPPYELLDPILERLIELGQPLADICAAGFDAAVVNRVAKMVFSSEYKRRQMPTGLIVTSKAFGPGRRYPVAQRYRG
jgi:NAD+ synthase (glutamine-hydrolysing)